MIIVTEKAKEQVKSHITGDVVGLSIEVVGGGCMGGIYSFGYAFEIKDTDYVVRDDDGSVLVIVDEYHLPFVDGATLDLVEENLGSYLVLDHPSADKCGCRKSFSLK